MKATKILFPTDFSPQSDAVLAYATSLVRDTGAKLLIVHVEEPPLAYGGGEMYVGPVAAAGNPVLGDMLAAVKPRDPAVPCEHRLLMGDPATEIIELGGKEEVDLIVMGTHGRTGVSRLLMGSVAELVVRKAPCPVLTLKQPQATEADT